MASGAGERRQCGAYSGTGAQAINKRLFSVHRIVFRVYCDFIRLGFPRKGRCLFELDGRGIKLSPFDPPTFAPASAGAVGCADPTQRYDKSRMTERALGILTLFSLERPTWSAEAMASEMGVSISSAYRFIARLEALGLISTAKPGEYVLGPAIIQYDRQIQLTDPLLTAARPVMAELAAFAPPGSVMLLCRSFGETVLCVHQVLGPGPAGHVSYERGRPIPLFRGGASKAILAHIPSRILKRLYLQHAEEIAASGLGDSWTNFKAALAQLRKTGFVVSRGELDPGRVGISMPLFDDDRRAIGSISYAIGEDQYESRLVSRLASLLAVAASEIESAMRNSD
jgi:DNA-binding IclR family transcriptional regulator